MGQGEAIVSGRACIRTFFAFCPDRIPASFFHRKLFLSCMAVFFIEAMNTLFSEKTTQVIFRWHGTTIPWKGDRGLCTETEYRQPLGIRPGAMFCLFPSLPESEYS